MGIPDTHVCFSNLFPNETIQCMKAQRCCCYEDSYHAYPSCCSCTTYWWIWALVTIFALATAVSVLAMFLRRRKRVHGSRSGSQILFGSRAAFNDKYASKFEEKDTKFDQTQKSSDKFSEERRYIPPPGQKYIQPQDQKYLPPPQDQKYLPPQDQKYLPPPQDKKYYPPQDQKYAPPAQDQKYLPQAQEARFNQNQMYMPPPPQNYGQKVPPPIPNSKGPQQNLYMPPPQEYKYTQPEQRYVPPPPQYSGGQSDTRYGQGQNRDLHRRDQEYEKPYRPEERENEANDQRVEKRDD